MSLLYTEAKPCMLIVETSIPDGRGGSTTMYTGTVHFDATITPYDGTGTKNIGNNEISAQKVKIMFKKGVPLELNSIVKCLEDNKTYKCTGNAIKCAASATMQYDLIAAEEWSLPNG